MGYDITLKPSKEEVEKIKEENNYLLKTSLYSDNSLYYEFLINLYYSKYEPENKLFKFQTHYNYFITMLKMLYYNAKKMAIELFLESYEEKECINYCGWDKSNCYFEEEKSFIEAHLATLIKNIYCTDWSNNDKLNYIEDFLNDFIDEACKNQTYYFINQFKNSSEENY
jgi:hypothetical protein